MRTIRLDGIFFCMGNYIQILAVPHILVMKGDFIEDVSLDPVASPPYDAFASWFMPTQEGSFGTIWNNGFLTCGGRINNITHEATDICKHVPIGNTVATNHPSLTRAFN